MPGGPLSADLAGSSCSNLKSLGRCSILFGHPGGASPKLVWVFPLPPLNFLGKVPGKGFGPKSRCFLDPGIAQLPNISCPSLPEGVQKKPGAELSPGGAQPSSPPLLLLSPSPPLLLSRSSWRTKLSITAGPATSGGSFGGLKLLSQFRYRCAATRHGDALGFPAHPIVFPRDTSDHGAAFWSRSQPLRNVSLSREGRDVSHRRGLYHRGFGDAVLPPGQFPPRLAQHLLFKAHFNLAGHLLTEYIASPHTPLFC